MFQNWKIFIFRNGCENTKKQFKIWKYENEKEKYEKIRKWNESNKNENRKKEKIKKKEEQNR